MYCKTHIHVQLNIDIYVKLRRLVGVEPITTVIRSGRLRWYGHVMRKSDEHWVKTCMGLNAEDQEGHGYRV